MYSDTPASSEGKMERTPPSGNKGGQGRRCCPQQVQLDRLPLGGTVTLQEVAGRWRGGAGVVGGRLAELNPEKFSIPGDCGI